MKRTHPLRRLAPRVLRGGALAGCALMTSTAHAGGIVLCEIATPDVGLASAGYAARANDALTLFKNPAGMSRLDGARFQVSHAINLGAAYTFMWAGNMSVDQGDDLSLRGRVSGSYDDAGFSFANVNMTWKF